MSRVVAGLRQDFTLPSEAFLKEISQGILLSGTVVSVPQKKIDGQVISLIFL